MKKLLKRVAVALLVAAVLLCPVLSEGLVFSEAFSVNAAPSSYAAYQSVFADYVNDELVPKIGLCSNFNKDVAGLYETEIINELKRYAGLSSVYIKDFDNDGVPEMITVEINPGEYNSMVRVKHYSISGGSQVADNGIIYESDKFDNACEQIHVFTITDRATPMLCITDHSCAMSTSTSQVRLFKGFELKNGGFQLTEDITNAYGAYGRLTVIHNDESSVNEAASTGVDTPGHAEFEAEVNEVFADLGLKDFKCFAEFGGEFSQYTPEENRIFSGGTDLIPTDDDYNYKTIGFVEGNFDGELEGISSGTSVDATSSPYANVLSQYLDIMEQGFDADYYENNSDKLNFVQGDFLPDAALDSLKLYYALFDIDSNGEDELLVGSLGTTGEYESIYDIFALNGKTVSSFTEVSGGLYSRKNVAVYDNGLMEVYGSSGADSGVYSFYKYGADGCTPVLKETISHDWGKYYRGNHETLITEDQYNTIRDGYVNGAKEVELDWKELNETAIESFEDKEAVTQAETTQATEQTTTSEASQESNSGFFANLPKTAIVGIVAAAAVVLIGIIIGIVIATKKK